MKNALLYISIIINISLLTFVYYKIYKPQASIIQFKFAAARELEDATTDEDIIKIGKKLFTEPVILDTVKRYVRNFVDSTYNYRSTTVPVLKDSIERSVYFDLDLILLSLNDVKTRLGGNDSDYGFRIYFGRYTHQQMCIDTSAGHTPHQYQHRFTSILVLTKDKKNIRDSMTNTANPARLIRTQFNLGGLCPPDCPDGYSANDPMYY